MLGIDNAQSMVSRVASERLITESGVYIYNSLYIHILQYCYLNSVTAREIYFSATIIVTINYPSYSCSATGQKDLDSGDSITDVLCTEGRGARSN